jgi:MFS family permease
MVNTRLRGAFPAFSYRNYRLFFFGQCVSLIGTWMQNVGQQLLVQHLTNSPLKMGIVSAVQFLPMLLFALVAGALVDRLPKRTVLLITQSALALLALILATLTFFNVVQYWHVLVLAALLGIVNTLDMPTRQSFFVEMVGRDHLMNAIALNSTMFNLARIVGPAAAGLLIGWVGLAACFYINAFSFLAVIAGLWMMDIRSVPATAPTRSIKLMIGDIRQGLSYIREKPLILYPLLLLALTSAFVMNFNTILPFYNSDVLGKGDTLYGILLASMGVGSFAGALLIAARSRSGPRPAILLAGAAGMSVLLAAGGFISNYYAACALLLALGFCMITFTTLVNSTIQLNSDDRMRGRVMSVYSLVFGGVTPIGGLYAGKLTEATGVPASMIVSGAIGVAAVAFVAFMLFCRKKKNNQNIVEEIK